MKKTITTRLVLLVVMLLTILPASAYDFEVDGFYYDVVSLPDLTCRVMSGDKKYEGDIVIPSEVTYNGRTFKVTEIGSKAFYGCSALTSVVIGDSVTEIGAEAFYGCSALTSVVIGDSVTEIGDYAFGHCTSLTSVVIPDSVTEIGRSAFAGCSSLEEIKLSEFLSSISLNLFANCSHLRSLSIPGSVKTITLYKIFDGYRVSDTWYNCEALNEIRIEYGQGKLSGCFLYDGNLYNTGLDFMMDDDKRLNIEKIFIDRELSNSLTLPYLEELTLGEHVEKVQVEPKKSENLDSIVCYAQEPPVAPEFTNAQYMNVKVRVPNESLEKYRNAKVWKNFWNLEGFDPSSAAVEEVMSSDSVSEIGRYDINGRPVSNEYKGMVVVRYSDGSTKKILEK